MACAHSPPVVVRAEVKEPTYGTCTVDHCPISCVQIEDCFDRAGAFCGSAHLVDNGFSAVAHSYSEGKWKSLPPEPPNNSNDAAVWNSRRNEYVMIVQCVDSL